MILGTDLSFYKKYIFLSPIKYDFKNIVLHFVLIIILSLILVFVAMLFNYTIIKFMKYMRVLKYRDMLKSLLQYFL